MRKYLVMHTHDYGITTVIVAMPSINNVLTGENWYNDEAQLKKLAEKLSLNYEPHKDEHLEIDDITADLPIMLSMEDVNYILSD